MGLSDFINRWKSERDQKALAKNIKRLIHQDVQHEDRLQAAEFLSEVGTPEAIYGLLRRYDMSLEKSYMDQDEKSYVHDLVVAKGERALDPLKQFLRDSENLGWPERILVSILKDEVRVVEVLLEVVDAERGGSDMRGPKRANLLGLLKHYKDARIAPAVVEFLEDFDESVRVTATDVLEHQGDPLAAAPLAAVLANAEEESFRVKRRVVEALAKQGWPVPDVHRAGAQRFLPSGYSFAADGRIQGS